MAHWLNKVVELLEADTSNLRELARLAGGDPSTFYRGVNFDRVDAAGQDVSGMLFGNDSVESQESSLLDRAPKTLLRTIRGASRYEDRLVRLIDLLITDRASGLEVLAAYETDMSKHAQIVLRNLSAFFENASAPPTNLDLVRFVRFNFSHVMPGSRAAILYYMVVHLAKHEELRPFLVQWWRNSYSYSFRGYQREIERLLEVEPRPLIGS